MMFPNYLLRFIVLFSGIPTLAFVQQQNSDSQLPVSVFTLPLDNGSENYTFALNLPSDSEEVYFRLAGPAIYSWIAVGTGSEMKDSLMLLVYLDSAGSNVTLSPRLCTGETEPVFSSSLDVEILSRTGVVNNTMTVNGRCSNCRSWNTGSLDVNSTTQPWIYALGPDSSTYATFKSDSKLASIERHSLYGRFTMNMVQATGGDSSNSISSMQFTTSTGSAEVGQPDNDSNLPTIIHAVVICTAFIAIMPGGIIMLRVIPASVRWHWVNQSVAAILAGIGGILGLWLSTMFNKSKHYNSAHQVLGLICVIATFIQWGLGFWHHRQYKRTLKSTKYAPTHRYLGRFIIPLAIVTGGIGLTWSYASRGVVIGYVVAVIVLAVATTSSVMWKSYASLRSQRTQMTVDEREIGSSPAKYVQNYRLDSGTVLTDFPQPMGTR
ncbi:uncharacterized protein TRUGW13939_06389 [Talaromyces rugulosus]|uniref:DOMON domain-containing protein n=1 Tax=Talaromyces rugulosus TaxID=121627 RepID=A0A7H8QZ58_TALRU|nr:uncharacterized protein TRUGW13939_06389 [Talaromyces rugulosus]QKX59257.1 hypothetical protein TRUGW13939_06389 [Talaromyces rugulosus]